MAAGMVKVWEVLADTEEEGPAGDGTVVFRFKAAKTAATFAAGSTCYGRPAKATLAEVPRRLAARWGVL